MEDIIKCDKLASAFTDRRVDTKISNKSITDLLIIDGVKNGFPTVIHSKNYTDLLIDIYYENNEKIEALEKENA